MRKWRNRLLHQDLKVSVSSPVNLLRPSRAGSLRRMPGSQRTSRRGMEMMNAWRNPTVAWRPGKICPSYTETFPEGWCPPHWRTWTSSTPIRRWVCIYISQVHKGTARGPKHLPEDWDLKSYSNLRFFFTERHGKKLYRCFWNWKHVKYNFVKYNFIKQKAISWSIITFSANYVFKCKLGRTNHIQCCCCVCFIYLYI